MTELHQNSVYKWSYDFDSEGALVLVQEDKGVCSTASRRFIRIPPEAVRKLYEILKGKEGENAGETL